MTTSPSSPIYAGLEFQADPQPCRWRPYLGITRGSWRTQRWRAMDELAAMLANASKLGLAYTMGADVEVRPPQPRKSRRTH